MKKLIFILVSVLLLPLVISCDKEEAAFNPKTVFKVSEITLHNKKGGTNGMSKASATQMALHATQPAIEIKTLRVFKFYKYNGVWNHQETIELPYSEDVTIPDVLMAKDRFGFQMLSADGKVLYYGITEKDFSKTTDLSLYSCVFQQKAELNFMVKDLLETNLSYEMTITAQLQDVDYDWCNLESPVTTAVTIPTYFYIGTKTEVKKVLTISNGVVKLDGEIVNGEDWINILATYAKGTSELTSLQITVSDGEETKLVLNATANLLAVGVNHNITFKNTSNSQGQFDLIDNDDILSDITIVTPTASLKDGLVAWWNMTMRPSPGTSKYEHENLEDQSGNNHHLYKVDNAVLNANNIGTKHGFVGVAINNILQSSFTVGTWIYPKQLGNCEYSIFFANHTDDTYGFNSRLYISGNKIWLKRHDLDGDLSTVDISQLQTNRWFFVVLQIENNYTSVYVNGELCVKLPFSDDSNWSGDCDFYFGSDLWQEGCIEYSAPDFDGNINRSFLYNKILSIDEIRKLYNNGDGLFYEQL